MGSIWRGMDDVTFSALLAIGIEAAAWNYCDSTTLSGVSPSTGIRGASQGIHDISHRRLRQKGGSR